jgi:hypothetical protein
MRQRWALVQHPHGRRSGAVAKFPLSQNWFGGQKAAIAKARAVKTLFGIKIYEATSK